VVRKSGGKKTFSCDVIVVIVILSPFEAGGMEQGGAGFPTNIVILKIQPNDKPVKVVQEDVIQ
jgi:hypothetical protein